MTHLFNLPSSRCALVTHGCFVLLLLSVFFARSSALECGDYSTCDDGPFNLRVLDITDEGAPHMLQKRAWLPLLTNAMGRSAAESGQGQEVAKNTWEGLPETLTDVQTDLKAARRTSALPASLFQESSRDFDNFSKGAQADTTTDEKAEEGAKTSTCMCSAHVARPDLHMSEGQILAELQVAKARVNTLEALLANSKSRANDVKATSQANAKQSPDMLLATHKTRGSDVLPREGQTVVKESPGSSSSPGLSMCVAKLASLCVFSLVVVAFAVWKVLDYEKKRAEIEPPWFHNSLLLTKLLGVGACLWLTFGIFIFTEILVFTNAGRYLTITEAVYLNSQLITTVGYGDLTPTTSTGSAFMMFYAVVAVFLFGTLTQHMIMMYIELSGESDSSGSWAGTLVPTAACCIFGTLFFAFYPGEGKTILQSMNMTVITFITVGFGNYVPVTKGGQLVASVWMVVGVLFAGKAIVDFTTSLFTHRQNLRSQAAAVNAFNEIDSSHNGFIDKVQFLTFELIQEGHEKSVIDKILAKFDEFDLEHDNTLSFEEFKAYVDTVQVS